MNVKIGKVNGFENFFNMQQYNHRVNIEGFYPEKGDCNATIESTLQRIETFVN